MNVFVTGGSGFVGGRLIRRLVSEGHTVLALARSEKAEFAVKALGAKPVRGHFDNLATWESRLRGAHAVVHCAAPVEVWGKWRDFHRDITLASRDLVEAADRQGVKKFIFLSTDSVWGDKVSLLDIDEDFPLPDKPDSYYGHSKKLAEEAILAADVKIDRIILRPTFIWGPQDNVIPKIVAKIKKGQFYWVGQGKNSNEMVHVDNLVEAIVLSCQKGKDKSIYIVTDDSPLPTREFFSMIFNKINVPIPKKNLPIPIARALVAFVETLWKLFHLPGHPPFTRLELGFVSTPRKYRIERIKTDLGYRPVRTREEGLNELKRIASQTV